jgi:hypothetical protein
MEIALIDDLCRRVPAMAGYPTIATLRERAHRLAARHPDACSLRVIGESRAGEPLLHLRIGSGRRSALLIGLPHPDEPIGAAMLDFFCERLAADPALQERFDYTWHVVPYADPDGARLNEGWYGGPFDPIFFGRHYYRPIESDQFEWSFPIDYKRLRFATPNPESAAVARLVDETRLDYLANLHNCTVGGAYLYLSQPRPALYEAFYETLQSVGVPPHRGQPEVPYLRSLDGDAVFAMYGTRDVYDFYERTHCDDPTAFIDAGTCTDEYVIEKWGAFSLVCEMPYFAHEAVSDRTPLAISRRELLTSSWQDELPRVRWVQAFHQQWAPRMQPPPLAHVIDTYARTYAAHREAELRDASDAPATRAQQFDATIMRGYDHLFMLGQLCRTVAHVPEAAARAVERYDAFAGELRGMATITAPPPHDLVRAMLRMTLLGAC